MRDVSAGMATLLTEYQFFVAELYTITFANGDVVRFTSGDGDIRFGSGGALALPNTGAGIADGNTDPHYAFTTLQGTATGTGGYACVPSSGIHYRSAADAVAKWLTPSIDSSQSYDNNTGLDGIYRYRLSVDLSHYDLASVSMAGTVSADNKVDVVLNGTTLVANATAFSIASGFISGVNTLDFVVTNDLMTGEAGSLNPTGLIVQFTSVTGIAYDYLFTAFAIERGDITTTTGVSVDDCTVTLRCNTDNVFKGVPLPHFARIGGFDNAHIKIELAVMPSYGDTSNGLIHLFEGRVTDINPDMASVALTVSADTIMLDTQIPQKVYQPSCAHTLYDSGCGLSEAAFTESATVLNSNPAGGEIWFNSSNGAGFFTLGRMVFTSGQNAGFSRTVKFHSNDAGVAVAIPNAPFPFPTPIGDSFNIIAGCDKLRGTCASKFSNASQFLGWEYMPVPEASV